MANSKNSFEKSQKEFSYESTSETTIVREELITYGAEENSAEVYYSTENFLRF